MQPHRIADQLRGQHVAFDGLSDEVDAGHHQPHHPGVELGQSDAHGDDEADDRPDIGDEREHSGPEADQDGEVQAGDAEGDRVVRAEDEANQPLPPEKVRQRAIDLRRQMADRRRVGARQMAVDGRDQAIPVAQQIERHHGRDDEQRDDVEDGHATAPYMADDRSDPVHRVAGILAEGRAEFLDALPLDPLLKPIHNRRQERVEIIQIRWQGCEQPTDLLRDNRYQDDEQGRQHDHEAEKHERRRQPPRRAALLDPSGHRVQQIGDDDPRHKRHQGGPQQPDQHAGDQKADQPEADLLVSRHLGRRAHHSGRASRLTVISVQATPAPAGRRRGSASTARCCRPAPRPVPAPPKRSAIGTGRRRPAPRSPRSAPD